MPFKDKEKARENYKKNYNPEKRKEYSRNYRILNLEKIREYERNYSKNNRDKERTNENARKNYDSKKKRNRHLKREYGIDIETYNAMLELQNFRCAICNKESEGNALHVDHDHVTGKVRGLLCYKCNSAIGKVKDDISVMEKALSYIKFHKRGAV